MWTWKWTGPAHRARPAHGCLTVAAGWPRPRAPDPACTMRAQRNAIHSASHRASPARRNPPALDPRHPTSHHAGPGDTTKTTPPGGSALGGPVRRQGLVRLPPGAGLSGEGLTARPSRPNDSPGGGAQADGATDTTADDHPAVNTPPRTRPTATPSPRPRTDVSSEKGLLCDFHYTICVWMAGPREPGSG